MSKLGLSSQILQTAIHGKAHLCDVIFWNPPCVFAMRCGKNRTLFDFLPALQITRAGSACMEMIHGFKEGWIIWHPRGCARGPARVEPYQWKRALSHSVSGFNPYISMPQATWRCRVEISVKK